MDYHQTILFCMMFISSCKGTFRNVSFRRVQGYAVTGTNVLGYTVSGVTVLSCTAMCLSDEVCQGANFNTVTRQCTTLLVSTFDDDAHWSPDTSWDVLIPLTEHVNHSGWTLVFRGTNDVRQKIYDKFLYTGYADDSPLSWDVEPGCLRMDTQLPCNQHFRSSILDSWESEQIFQVRFTVYSAAHGPIAMVFNGDGSSLTNWFSKGRLLTSHWTDMMSENAQHFSIFGMESSWTSEERRFYINRAHSGCPADTGWFAVIDTPTMECEWITGVDDIFPLLIYSPFTTYTTWANDLSIADFLAIHVTFK